MKLQEIIALTRAGYTKKDIDRIISEEDQTPKAPAEEPAATPAEPEKEPETQPAEGNSDKSEPDEPVIDYKKMYEESQQKIAQLQKDFTSRNNSGNKPKELSVNEILDELMNF